MEAKELLGLILFGAVFVFFYANFLTDDPKKASSWQGGALAVLYYALFFPFILIKWLWDAIGGKTKKGKKDLNPSQVEKVIVTCSKCGQKLRVPTNVELEVACPKCKNNWRRKY